MLIKALLVDRNIIKFDLMSREKSLQPPGLFLDAFDVKYFDTSKGTDADILHCVSKKRPTFTTCYIFTYTVRLRQFLA